MNPTLQRTTMEAPPCPLYGPYSGTPFQEDICDDGEETDYTQNDWQEESNTEYSCDPYEDEEQYDSECFESEVPSTDEGDYFDDEFIYDPNYYEEEEEPCPSSCPDPADYECPLPGPCMPCPCPEEETVAKPTTEYVEHGNRSMCGNALKKVNEIIKNITPRTVLDEFMLSISNYTNDNGELMFDLMSTEVNNFKELIKEIYANRNDTMSDLLKAEQRQLKNKYDKWTKELDKQSEETLEKLKERVPGFDLRAYYADPKEYIYNLMESTKKEQAAAGVIDHSAMTNERNHRVGMHKRTWLTREAERIECENEERRAKMNEMMTQLACLSEGLATSNKKLAAYNRQLESHASCLRNKLAYNETLIGCLLDELETAKVGEEEAQECPFIEPDEILTPYPSGYDYC